MAPRIPDVSLSIADRAFGGWKSNRIRRAMDEAAASFSLALTDRWSATSERVPLKPFTPVSVSIDGERVIEGYIDEATPEYDAEDWTVAVSGRSRTGQLVDCSASYGTGSVEGRTIDGVAELLAAPFGIGVVLEDDAGAAFASVQIEPGETVMDVLDRLSRQRRLWVSDTPDGNLRLLRRSSRVQGVLKGPLSEPRKDINILKASGRLDGTEQYSDYRVLGQTVGSDLWGPSVSAAATGTAKDASVPLHRPLTLLAEAQGADAALRERAVHEAALRRGRAHSVDYTVAGWHRADGKLWTVGETVSVTDGWLGIEAELLVVSTEFVRSEQDGIVTTLTCAEPEAWDLLATPEVKKTSPLWGDPA